MSSKNFAIEGMRCDHCVKAIRDALLKIDGVNEVAVSLSNRAARVDFDEKKANAERIIATVEGIGFDASLSE